MFKTNRFIDNFIKGKKITNKYLKYIYYYIFIFPYVKMMNLYDYDSIHHAHSILKAFNSNSDTIKVYGNSIYIGFSDKDLLFRNLEVILYENKINIKMEDNRYIHNISIVENTVAPENYCKLKYINLILKDLLNIEIKRVFMKEEI